MEYQDLIYFIQHVGKDPSRLIFEDELTGLYNRRFLLNYFQYKIEWDRLDQEPVSLVMMDIDHFKEINDTHGHETGDQALVWVAGILRRVGEGQGLPIRYAGDEFMVLMPGATKAAAIAVGEELLERTRSYPFVPEGAKEGIHISLSIGVASAPEDARHSKELLHKADTALYYAKKAGRNQMADVGNVSPEEVFSKTAFYQLEGAKIAGRSQQLGLTAQALKLFSKRQNQFLLIDGGPGMGKSEFLEAIHRNLAQTRITFVKVAGNPQEMMRPYYLAGEIIIELLKRRQDKGAAVFEALEPREVAALPAVLPQLAGEGELEAEMDDQLRRQLIFAGLLRLLALCTGKRPLILLLDDFHYADEASLLLLRQLYARGEIPVFIAATASSEILAEAGQGEPLPLARFCQRYQQELQIKRIELTPLTAADIREHLQTIFPRIQVDQEFVEEVHRVSQGNPLFVSEIVRKLVFDQKIVLAGQQWLVAALEPEYLPRSLEDIVREKIAALDEESRRLLDQASVFGGKVSLSQLTGSSKEMEARVADFVDKAMASGLLRSDFQMDEETISFLGRQIQEIAYDAIQEDQRQELHANIAEYQEALYAQRLLPSAASLAYHFLRAANAEKARHYLESQQSLNEKIFRAEEAEHYTGDETAEEGEGEAPLDEAAIALVPPVIRALLLAIRNVGMYPPGSKAIVTALAQLRQQLLAVLAHTDRFSIVQEKEGIVVNGEPLETADFQAVADAFVKFLRRIELRGLVFRKGVSEREIATMVEALARVDRKSIHPGFWRRFCNEQRLVNLRLNQVEYTQVGAAEKVPREKRPPPPTAELNVKELTQIAHLIRCFLTAVNRLRLYPAGSTVTNLAVDEFKQAIDDIVNKRQAITLARVADSLLVDGRKIDTSEIETLARAFIKVLEEAELRSITFLRAVPPAELLGFLGALAARPPDGYSSGFWRHLAQEHKFGAILLNELLYSVRGIPVGMGLGGGKTAGAAEEAAAPAAVEVETPAAEPVTESGVATEEAPPPLPEVPAAEVVAEISDHFLAGEVEKAGEKLAQLFHGYAQRQPEERMQVVEACGQLLQTPTLAPQQQFARLVLKPLIAAFGNEEDAEVLAGILAILRASCEEAIHYRDYQVASWVLTALNGRFDQLARKDPALASSVQAVVEQQLSAPAQQLILADLTGDDPATAQAATQLLASLGKRAVGFLLDIMREQEDLRVRQIAARLLARLGPDAEVLVRKQLAGEASPRKRVRLLETIDSVTTELKTELAACLGDADAEVRAAAFRLAERLQSAQVREILLDYAGHQDVRIAVAALSSLGKMSPPPPAEKIIEILENSSEPQLVAACCRTLAQLGDMAAIGPLARILRVRRFLPFAKKYDGVARAAAALALSQIDEPEAREVLARYVEDADPRVRQIAGAALGGGKSESS